MGDPYTWRWNESSKFDKWHICIHFLFHVKRKVGPKLLSINSNGVGMKRALNNESVCFVLEFLYVIIIIWKSCGEPAQKWFFWHWAMKCEGDQSNWKYDWLVLLEIKFCVRQFCARVNNIKIILNRLIKHSFFVFFNGWIKKICFFVLPSYRIEIIQLLFFSHHFVLACLFHLRNSIDQNYFVVLHVRPIIFSCVHFNLVLVLFSECMLLFIYK